VSGNSRDITKLQDKEEIMKPIIYLVALLSLLDITPAAWAGAAEEIAAIGQRRNAAFEKGDADANTADFADNAVYTSSLEPYRIEGKAAIRDFFAALFETYATRHIAPRGGFHTCLRQRYRRRERRECRRQLHRQKWQPQRHLHPWQHNGGQGGQ